MIELEGGPEGQVECPAADGLEGVGEGVEALAAKALGPDDDCDSCDQACEDAACGADPMVVDGPLEKESGGNEKRDDTDAAEELGADAVFEGAAGFGAEVDAGDRGEGWSSRRRWRRG